MGLFLALLPLCVLLTATLSGVFGMAGGMLLMGIYAACLPVQAAMVLHAVTQIASNGSRAVVFRDAIYRPALSNYVLGALPAVALFLLLRIVVDRGTLFLAMGALPLLVALLPRSDRLRIETPVSAMACGFVVTVAQLTAGVSGPLLDAFFVRGHLTRHQVIGTKAVTQTLGHVLKLLYFGSLLSSSGEARLPLWVYPIAVGCALGGTLLGKRILQLMSDRDFRRWSTRIVIVLALLSIGKGVHVLGGGS